MYIKKSITVTNVQFPPCDKNKDSFQCSTTFLIVCNINDENSAKIARSDRTREFSSQSAADSKHSVHVQQHRKQGRNGDVGVTGFTLSPEMLGENNHCKNMQCDNAWPEAFEMPWKAI